MKVHVFILFCNTSISDNKKHIIIDGKERLTPLGSIIGHICKNGKLCGHVLKFGLRIRDPVCDIVQHHNLAYVGYHDPISGDSLGPTIHVLVGTSVLYNPHGKLPGDILLMWTTLQIVLL